MRLIYRQSNPEVDNGFLYHLHNAHGDVTKLLNEKGEVIRDYSYDPFGQEQALLPQTFGGNQGLLPSFFPYDNLHAGNQLNPLFITLY